MIVSPYTDSGVGADYNHSSRRCRNSKYCESSEGLNMNRFVFLLVMLLVMVVDVWSLYNSDWLLFGMNTALGLSLLVGLRKSTATRQFQVVLFSVAFVIGVIRLAIILFR